MTKFKKVLSKIYYYTWRILLIIILCCLSVYSIANTVNYFVDRNKLVESSISDIRKSFSDIRKLVNPSNNPQGYTLNCPITNYFSYNDRSDMAFDFGTLLDDQLDTTCNYQFLGNVLTFKDFTDGGASFKYWITLEDLPVGRYFPIIKINSYNEFNIYVEFDSDEGNIVLEGDANTTYFYDSSLYLANIEARDSTQTCYLRFENNDYEFLQFEIYLFSLSDLENYFGDDDIASLIDYIPSLCIPYGYDYIQGQGNNYFYDSTYIQGMLEDKYHEGYNVGYDDGGLVGYNEGYVDGKQDGESIGYQNGYNDASSVEQREAFQDGYNAGLTAQFNKGGFLGLANLIFNAPYNILHEVFNFEFLGVNLWGLMSFAFTTALIFAVIKLFM